MEIEKSVSPLGYATLEFMDVFDTLCRLWVLKNAKQLRLDLNADVAQFTQGQIKTLLPYIQSFAETGTLELQGGSVDEKKLELDKAIKGRDYYMRQCDKQVDEIANLEDQLETMQEAGVAMANNIVDQGKRIEALQELVREWRAFGWTDDVSGSLEWLDLDTKSAQLLGEEPQL